MPSNSTDECRLAIIASLANIPYGKICSYGAIATISGYPGQARYVAYILKTLPKDSTIPWHRVINAQGKVAFPKGSEKYQEQAMRLQEEGIPTPISKHSLRHLTWLGE